MPQTSGSSPARSRGLLAFQLDLEVEQALVAVEPADHREAVLGEERLEPVESGAVKTPISRRGCSWWVGSRRTSGDGGVLAVGLRQVTATR